MDSSPFGGEKPNSISLSIPSRGGNNVKNKKISPQRPQRGAKERKGNIISLFALGGGEGRGEVGELVKKEKIYH
jgi:hypothetical protein